MKQIIATVITALSVVPCFGQDSTQLSSVLTDTLTLLQEFVPDESLMEYVKETARNNEFFAGGAVLTALGAVAMYGRGVFAALMVRIDRLLRYQMTISQNQSYMLYTAFNSYLSTSYPHKVRNSLASVSQEGQSPQMEAKLELRQATDAIMIWVRWWPVFISKKRDRMDNASSMDVSFDEEYRIWAFFGRRRIIRFVSKILEDHVAELNKEGVPAIEVCTFSSIYGNIKEQRITSFKTFDTLYLGKKGDEIKADLDKFLSAGETYRRLGIRNKRSYLLYGPPGCHAADTEILMFDGSIKKVQDVEVGDLLMGPDSKPRTVLELRRGVEKMVRITPHKGEPFVVNNSHILHLTPSGERDSFAGPVNVPFHQYAKQSVTFRDRFKLTRTGVEFGNSPDLKIPPYILGLWLGDGTSARPMLTTIDQEIEDEWVSYGASKGLTATIYRSRKNTRVKQISLVTPLGQANPLIDLLREYDILNNKHVPKDYLTASREDRLQLLAGLIDTDGHVDGGGKGMYGSGIDIVQKRKEISDAAVFIARSLGFRATQRQCTKGYTMHGKYGKFEGTYYRVHISGDLTDIPCRLERKQTNKGVPNKDPLRTGFTYKMLPEDNYYGFTLNKDHLYLTADFMIHHNTGKSSVAIAIAAYTGRRLVPCPIADMTTQSFVAGIRNLGNEPLLLLFDDVHVYWETENKTVSISSLLSVLDGIDSPNDVIIVFTANRTESMDAAFMREGRIDRQWFVGNTSLDDVCRFYKDLFGEELPAAYVEGIDLPMCAVQEAALQMDGPDPELFHQKLSAACSTRNS